MLTQRGFSSLPIPLSLDSGGSIGSSPTVADYCRALGEKRDELSRRGQLLLVPKIYPSCFRRTRAGCLIFGYMSPAMAPSPTRIRLRHTAETAKMTCRTDRVRDQARRLQPTQVDEMLRMVVTPIAKGSGRTHG